MVRTHWVLSDLIAEADSILFSFVSPHTLCSPSSLRPIPYLLRCISYPSIFQLQSNHPKSIALLFREISLICHINFPASYLSGIFEYTCRYLSLPTLFLIRFPPRLYYLIVYYHPLRSTSFSSHDTRCLTRPSSSFIPVRFK